MTGCDSDRAIVVLTGGPGGGKSALLEELRSDLDWSGRFVALPETVHFSSCTGVSPRERLFQRVIVELQRALEVGLSRALGPNDSRPIICHRGTLDPLAFWLDRGWPKDEFFEFTNTDLEGNYQRYTAVIHLVTAADGALNHYLRWPGAHRPEEPEHAIRLDRYLHEIWHGHPCYSRIGNEGRDWLAKSREAKAILRACVKW